MGRFRDALLVLLLGSGCYVGLEGGAAEGGAADGGASDGDGDGGSSDDGGEPADPRMIHECTDANLRGTSRDAMRRLSKRELVNTLADLLGADVIADETIATRLAGLPEDETVIAGDFATDPPVGLALAMSGVAERAAEVTLGDPQWVAAHLPACVAAGTLDDACIEAVVRELGGKIWRRDPSDDEVAAYVTTFAESGGGDEGLRYLLRRLLQSPALVFHIEDGTGEIEDGRIRLAHHEIANRIAYAVIDSMPDDELMAAARAGELDDVAAVEAHVRRLLEDPRAVAKTSDFFRYYSRITSVAEPSPAAAANAGVFETAGIAEQLRDEAFEYWAHIVSSDGDFTELMASHAAFPRSDALATIFGSAMATDDAPIEAPAHAGLLHRPALLVSGGARTSPIIRGAHVRKLFMCDVLGLPDPDAVMERQDEVGDLEHMSNRDKITELTSANACIGCHGLVNPVGFTFEGYDQLGAVRNEESIFDADGNVVEVWPIDTKVEDVTLEPDLPTSFADSRALAEAMSQSWRARACFAQRTFEYWQMRAFDERDECALADAEAATHDGTLVDVFVATIANEDIFWRAAP
ncbi:MAG TPA: DUF1592 domain-containing protein [Nannocystaceae bacterium]|nr:DUF1592 domain-containing protein [Nannocystaceae bacterium]